MSGSAQAAVRMPQAELQTLAADVALLLSSAQRIKDGMAELQRLAMLNNAQNQTNEEWLSDYDRGQP